MEFRINKNSEFPIYQQLKEQIKFYLLSGALQPGTRIPTPKDLGSYLQINRNTVIAAYKELEKEGLLVSKHGQGSFVAENIPNLPHNERRRELIALANETLMRTKELGFMPEDLFTVIFNQTVLHLDLPETNTGKSHSCALMIECNSPDLKHYQDTLRTELGIEVNGYLLDELPDKTYTDIVKRADFVVTNFTHLEDVKAILEPFDKKIFGVMAVPHFQIFMKIGQLPAGTRVGVVCVKEQWAARMRKALEDGGIKHVSLEHSGTDDLENLGKMMRRVDYLVCSRPVIETVKKLTPSGIKVLEFSNELDRAGIEMIKQYLAKQKTSNEN